jgi:5-methylcytosine-specific restriction enzyme subunit McrC
MLIELTEWDRAAADRYPVLTDQSLIERTLANPMLETLRDRIRISHTHSGLEIVSASYVGRIDIGSLRIAIRPKLPMMPLARLLRYAYGLRDLTTLKETHAPTVTYGLHDLLIAMLIAEVEELIKRGLARRYVSRRDKLDSPRGRILVEELARAGGVKEARLPCRYFERNFNWNLNQIIRTGLNAAARMTDDREVRLHLHKLANEFEGVDPALSLRTETIDLAERNLSRLTVAYTSALTILRLLHEMQGLDFESETHLQPMPGFLFDMNVFFQRLISRFLHDNLRGFHIVDERAIRTVFAYAPHANPRKRRVPAPRPDYALFNGNSLMGYLDAKYRDVWEKGFPAEWLYQLSVYALGSPARVSVLLYASMAGSACDEQIDIRSPMHRQSDGSSAVILRPVPLVRLAQVIDRRYDPKAIAERTRLAAQMTALRSRTQPEGRRQSAPATLPFATREHQRATFEV